MRVEDGRTTQTGAKDVFLGAFPSVGRRVHVHRRSVFSIVSPCHGRSDQIVTPFPAAVASWSPAGDQLSTCLACPGATVNENSGCGGCSTLQSVQTPPLFPLAR